MGADSVMFGTSTPYFCETSKNGEGGGVTNVWPNASTVNPTDFAYSLYFLFW
jgi:hypothetical protein